MKKALLKDSFKEIKKSYKRFISILLMAMLGVGFFVGIKATAPNMKYRLDDYFDKQNVFDLKVVATLGLTDEDIEAIKRLDGVKVAYGVYDKDVILEIYDTEYILSAMEYNPDINQIDLLEGSLPQNENECVVEENFISELNMNIGDTIQIKDDKTEDEEEVVFKNTELKIVGIVKSPLYISTERGNSKLGSGKVNYYIYFSENNIDSDIYTSIYITVDQAKELGIHTKQYDDLISNVKEELKNISSGREQARYDSLINEVATKINDAEIELNTEKEKAEMEIAKVEKELQDAEDKIINSEKELNSNISKANKEFANAENTLQTKEKEYNEGKLEAEKRNKTSRRTKNPVK